MSKMVWVLVNKGSKCLGHGGGNATTYELATDSICGGAPHPAFSSLEAAAEYGKDIDRRGMLLMSLEVLGDG